MRPRQIFLFSPVTSESSEYVIRQLLDMDRESNQEITMFINSPGGLVVEGFAVVDTMNIIKSPIRTVVMGMAASMAAVIASSGNKRLITENSQFMIHELWGGAVGSATEIDEVSEKMREMQDRLVNILAKVTNKDTDQLNKIMKKNDKYFSAKEAVNFGLADEIIKADEAQLLKLSEKINNELIQFDNESESAFKTIETLKTGTFVHPLYGEVTITEDHLNLMVKNFNMGVRGIDISFDFTHDNDNGEEPAALWVKSLEVRSYDKGHKLYATVEFTPKGLLSVKEKEYKYVSAEFCIDYVTDKGVHVPYVLLGGTLTNRPFIKELQPIKLSEYKPKNQEINKMEKEALIAALKVQGIDVVENQSKIQTLTAKIEELQNQVRDLGKLPAEKDTEIANLKVELGKLNEKVTNDAKVSIFENLVREGKVVPAQKDAVMKQFNDAEAMSAFYKDAPKVVNLAPQGGNGDGENEEFSEAEKALIKNGTRTKEDILKYGRKQKVS